MSKDKSKQDDPAPEDARKTEEASRETQKSEGDKDELDEGLEESLPASDAPAATRRSSKD